MMRDMERNEVSEHEARLYLALRRQKGWGTSAQLAETAGIAARTARAHLLKLTRLNVVDTAEVFPCHRYRLAEKASKRNLGYVTRLEKTLEVLGIS